MVDRNSIAQAVKHELELLYGERLAKVILYGSYARGDFNPDSDIDFLVVLRDNTIQTGNEIRRMAKSLSALDLHFNTYISAHPTTLQKLEQSDYIFYQNVRREGVEI
ncbi:MAG: nucleotidyltransferase domain-containing protein [Saprospiraceae bacterium]|nr:nucleotidyltransferase domain-containing protein [Saprospiraceae bacterium]